MTIERQLRRDMIILLRRIDAHPYKREREQLLWDVMYYCAGLLNVELEREKPKEH